MARPSKQTHALPAILAALQAGSTRTAAAQASGVHPTTLQISARSETVRVQLERAEGEAEARCVKTITLAMRRGWWQAAAWWLERRRAQDWGKVDRVEVTIRQQAEKIAVELGLSTDEVLAEADRIVGGGGGQRRTW